MLRKETVSRSVVETGVNVRSETAGKVESSRCRPYLGCRQPKLAKQRNYYYYYCFGLWGLIHLINYRAIFFFNHRLVLVHLILRCPLSVVMGG